MSSVNGGWRGPNIVKDGLVLYYDASSANSYNQFISSTTLRDMSGNGNNASLVAIGAVTASFDPNFSGVIQFAGSSSALLQRPVQDDFTLSCWFRTTQVAQGTGFPQWYGGMGLVDCEVANIVDDFGTSMGAGKVLFGVGRNTPSTDLTITSSLTYNDNAWHYMTATRVRSTGAMVLYVDAQQVATGTGSTNALTASVNMRVGAIQVNNNFFSGSIASVHVYNRALSATEVLQNYNATRARFGL